MKVKDRLKARVSAKGSLTNIIEDSDDEKPTLMSYVVYLSCRNLVSMKNSITFTYMYNGTRIKDRTEEVNLTQDPAFKKTLHLTEAEDCNDFTIRFSGNGSECSELSFYELTHNIRIPMEVPFGKQGTLLCQAVRAEHDEQLCLQVDAEKIPRMDFFFEGSKTDPYFECYLDEYKVYTSPYIEQVLCYIFTFTLPKCRLDRAQNMTLRFWDRDKFSEDDLIGYCSTPLEAVRNGTALQLKMSPLNLPAPKGLNDMRVSVRQVGTN